MTRMSIVLLLAMSPIVGCYSDPMGLRSPYRGRVVAPSANTQPFTNQPVASQSGGRLGQPVGVGQSVIMQQSPISNLAVNQGQRFGSTSPYPMFASAGGQVDGRAYPMLNRDIRYPRTGGSRPHKSAVRNTADASNTAIAVGLAGSPQEDLRFRGGHTIKDLKFVNIYVGGSAAWDPNDWKSIDKALAAAMADQRLNNVIMQYFGNQPVSSQFLGSFFLNGWKPATVQKSDMDAQIQNLYAQHVFDGKDLANTVYNFILPRGTILGDPSGGQQQTAANKSIPLADAEDSTGGLGGYHGAAHVAGKPIYYAIGVFSERKADGTTNGIPVFDQNWKNVVATFYHELQEARTDADVDDAATGGMNVLGWTSDTGNEIGDYPIAEAKALLQVFQEVPLADGSGKVPVQFIYSNAVHGPEGPIMYPHGMEPPPGSNPPQNPPPPNNPAPTTPSAPVSGPTSTLPPDVVRMISNWDQLEDYVKKAILKLLS